MHIITALVLTLAFAATTLHSEPAAARSGPPKISASKRPPVPCDCSNCSAQHCLGRGGGGGMLGGIMGTSGSRPTGPHQRYRRR
jgi:hypothetical protein